MKTIKFHAMLLCGSVLSTPAIAQVAISALPAASALTGTESVPIVQSATTKKANANAFGPTIGTTPIISGANTKVLFDNSAVVGEYTISGTGNVCMTSNCVMTTPNIGTPSAATLTNATGLVPSTGLAATGTPSATTYLEGDNKWVTIAGSGTVTNVATGNCLTGGPITTTGTVQGTYLIDARTTTTETINANDACQLVTFNNASPVAVTIAQATGAFGGGWSVDIENKGAGPVTVTPTTSTVNGAATLVIPKNMGCTLVSDNTNYQVAQCTAVAQTPLTIGGNVSLTGASAIYVCNAACLVTPPVPVAGYQFCVLNDANVSTKITLGPNTGVFYQKAVAPGTTNDYGSTGGNIASAGNVGDMICIIGRDATHYLVGAFGGTWTNS